MDDIITVESSYEVYYETEITLPKDKTKDDIESIIHKWAFIWIQWKDGTESKFEQDYDMETVDDGKWPYRITAFDEDRQTIYERDL